MGWSELVLLAVYDTPRCGIPQTMSLVSPLQIIPSAHQFSNAVQDDVAAAACWSIVEADLGVIVVSLVVSRPILNHLLPEKIVALVRSTWSKLSSSFSPATLKTNLFSFRRIPPDPPVLPSFDDSDLRLAAKRQGEDSIDMNDMSTRGELEEYHTAV